MWPSQRFAAAVLLLSLVPVGTSAAEIPIRGLVAVGGEGQAGARVVLIPLSPPGTAAAPADQAVTDADGLFRLTAPDVGMWVVRVEAEGHPTVHAALVPLLHAVDLPQVELAASGSAESRIVHPWHALAGPHVRAGTGEPPFTAGRVVDRTTGRPIPHALVWRPGEEGGAVRGDADGHFRIAGADDDDGSLAAAAAGYLPSVLVLEGGREGAPTTIALVPASAVSGEVVDSEGRPVSGVEVAALVERGVRPSAHLEAAWPWLAIGPDGLSLAYGRSAANGSFQVSGLADTAYELTAGKPGFVLATVPVEPLAPGEERGGLRIVLSRGRTAVGRVADQDGVPVVGAQVRLFPLQESIWSFEPPESAIAATRDEGRFAIPRLSAGRHALEVRASGFAATVVRGLEIPAGEGAVEVGTVTLHPGAEIRGRVVDRQGEPLAGAAVELIATRYGRPEQSPRGSQTTSEANGRFVFSDLRPEERFLIAVSKPGWAGSRVDGVTAPTTQPLEIVLDLNGRISGRVVAEDGQPVPAAEIAPWFGGRVTSDGLGSFELDAVPPGPVVLVASARGFEPGQRFDLAVGPGDELMDVELVLRRGAVLEGRIFGPEGDPLADVLVCARPAGDDGSSRSRCDDLTFLPGRYRLDGVVPGRLQVTAQHDRYGEETALVDVGPGGRSFDLRVGGDVGVSGVITDESGRPLRGARVVLESERGDEIGTRTSSAVDGSFALPGAAKGARVVWAEKDGYAPGRSEVIDVGGGAVTGVVVRLGKGATLSGSVLGVKPHELPAMVVTLRYSPDHWSCFRLDPEGRFSIPHVASGTWAMAARNLDSGREMTRSVTIPPGVSEASVDFVFEPGSTLSGVILRDAAPLVGADVTLYCRAATWRITTDQDGAFRLQGLPTERCLFSLSGGGLDRGELLEIDGDRELNVVYSTVSVAGQVRDQKSRPIAGADFWLEFLEDETYWQNFSPRVLRSDPRGFFRLELVPEGTWKLHVLKEGYEDPAVVVELRSGQPVEDLVVEMNAAAPTGGAAGEPGGGRR